MTELYNGIILPNGKRVPFAHMVSDKVKVVDITIRNHPAYNRKGTAKQSIATKLIPKYEFIGSYGGQIVHINNGPSTKKKSRSISQKKTKEAKRKIADIDDEANEELSMWGPYQIATEVNGDYYVDAENGGNEMRYINDSRGIPNKEPNVAFFQSDNKLRGYYISDIYAIKTIQPGEELLISYGDDYWDDLKLWWERQNPHTCPNCDYRTHSRDNLRGHIRREGIVDKKFECDYCEQSFKYKQDFNEHVNLHTADIVYKCDDDNCNYITLSASGFSAHKISKHSDVRWKCFYCDMVFTGQSSQLKSHILRNHTKISGKNGRDELFDCDICDYRSTSMSRINNHVREVHDGEQNYKCDVCDKTFFAYRVLRGHVKLMHDPNKRPFACDMCSYSTFTEITLSRHRRREHVIKIYKNTVSKRIVTKKRLSDDWVYDGNFIDTVKYKKGRIDVNRE